MAELVILVIEDEDDVRDALLRDLEPFADSIRIEAAADVADARQAATEVAADGDVIGLVLADHRLPGESGVDYLVELDRQSTGPRVRKVLVTGQADHADTIRAVNDARLDHYIAKPWEPQALATIVRSELTEFVIGSDFDLLRFVPVLDGQRLLETYHHRTL